MKVNKAETKKTAIQLLKYGVIGASNTLITAVTFYVLNSLLSVDYVPANAAGYVLGVLNSFVWNRNWVFKTKQNLKREALLFVVGFLLCYGLQMGVSGILLEVFDMKHYTLDWIPNAGQNIVMLISMVVYTISNYIYNRTVTFKVKEPKE
ncbi:MAG: GtrA family protein [Bacteroidales bacterium]|nr:GtrA family protein [Bacteroidales bacterium]